MSRILSCVLFAMRCVPKCDAVNTSSPAVLAVCRKQSLVSVVRSMHWASGFYSGFPKISTKESSLLNKLPGLVSPTSLVNPSPEVQVTIMRTNVRNHFPRPCERKRIKVHGWRKRMSTLGGRKILMRRILKGRHVLSH